MTILTAYNSKFTLDLTKINQNFINKANIINTTQLNNINGGKHSHININEEVITFRNLFNSKYKLKDKIELQNIIINELQTKLDNINKGLYIVKKGARVGQLYINVNNFYNATEINDNGVWYIKGEFVTQFLPCKSELILFNNMWIKSKSEIIQWWSELKHWQHNPKNSHTQLINNGIIRDNIRGLYYTVNNKDIDIITQYQTFNINNINTFFNKI